MILGKESADAYSIQYSLPQAEFEIVSSWETVLDGAVNKRNRSTGETGEFASENLGSALNPGG